MEIRISSAVSKHIEIRILSAVSKHMEIRISQTCEWKWINFAKEFESLIVFANFI